MKNIAIGVFLLFYSLTGKSQVALLEHALPDPVDDFKFETIGTVFDSATNHLYIVTRARNALHAIKINVANYGIEGEVTGAISADERISGLYGCNVHGDTLVALYNGFHTAINFYTFIFSTHSFLSNAFNLEDKKEKLEDVFIHNNRIIFLGRVDNKNSKEKYLRLHMEQPGGIFMEKDFHFKASNLIEKRTGSPMLLLSSTTTFLSDQYHHVTVAPYREKTNVLSTVPSHNKIYCTDNKMILTEDVDNSTEVIDIDLNDFSTNYRVFFKDGMPEGAAWADCSNSFLLNNSLYQVKAGKGVVAVKITDLKENKLRKIFTCTTERNDFAGMTMPMIETNKIRMLDGLPVFFSKIKTNPMSIIAEIEKNQSIRLTVGALLIEYRMQGQYGGNTAELTTNAVYFESFLDPVTFNNVPIDTLNENHVDRVENLKTKIDQKIKDYSIVLMNGEYFYCYLNQRKNKVYISKI